MITLQKIEEAKLSNDTAIIDSEILWDHIEGHDTSDMITGERYYYNENDILNRQKYYYKDGSRVVDETKTNIKIPHNWHKLLVDQKSAYLVGRPPIIQVDDEEAFEDRLNLILGEEWHDTLNELAVNTSNKGTDWLHVYLDGEGLFKFIIIPAEEVIPIYDTSLQENLEGVIRYYLVEVNGDSRFRVEWWTRNNVTFYLEDENGILLPDPTEKVNPDSHFYHGDQGYGWTKVPFIEFPNNSKRVSDLKFYKELIDIYDSNVSDFANDLEDIQEAVTVLKGYQGTSLSEFNENKRYYKAIKVDGDGAVDKLEVNIPVEAKKEMLDRLEDNIFLFGQGVDIKSDKFGASPSGTALKFLYALLDLKASTMERKFRKSVKRLIWFTTEYINMIDSKDYDSTKVNTTFRKTMIANDMEDVEIAVKSQGIISEETIIANHPWTEEVGVEQERLEEAKNAYYDLDSLEVDVDEI